MTSKKTMLTKQEAMAEFMSVFESLSEVDPTSTRSHWIEYLRGLHESGMITNESRVEWLSEFSYVDEGKVEAIDEQGYLPQPCAS